MADRKPITEKQALHWGIKNSIHFHAYTYNVL
jgi:hypothetical protein